LSFEPQDEDAAGTEPEHVGRASGLTPEHRHESLVVRIAGFIRGSWRELQRVQWPDRRQVMQATGVVLGFVIVAGAFLGLADLVSSHIVKLIL